MAIIAVTRVREFQIDAVTNRGSEQYYIYFDAWTNHAQMASQCLGATDPSTSMTTPNRKGQSLDSVYFPSAIVDGLSPFPREGQNLSWQLNVSYGEVVTSGESVSSNSEVFDVYPWQLPKRYSWSHYFDQALMVHDKSGIPMLNSTGDRFETDVIVDRTIRTCQISFNTPLSNFDPKETGDFINTINSSSLSIAGSVFPKDTIKVLSYDSNAEPATVITKTGSVDIMYNQNTVSVAYDPFTWEGIILDIGNMERGATGRIADADGVGYATAQRLNGDGVRLLQVDGVTPNVLATNINANTLQLDVARSVTGVAAFMNYQRYNQKNLNILGL